MIDLLTYLLVAIHAVYPSVLHHASVWVSAVDGQAWLSLEDAVRHVLFGSW